MAAPALEGPSAPTLTLRSQAHRGNEAEEKAAAGPCHGPLRVLARGRAPPTCCRISLTTELTKRPGEQTSDLILESSTSN